jgi:hypothetical protein
VKIIVCGSRLYKERKIIFDALDAIHDESPITLLIEGGAKGADRIARDWAESRGVEVHTEPPDWDKYGDSAGPIRNNKMLMMKPDLVLAFPGNQGTLDCMKQARRLGIEVIEWEKV